jgi:hypothetical protein
MKIKIHIVFLIILSLAIALSPSFVVGEISGGREIEIRLEDILIAVFGLLWIAEFLILKTKKIKRPPLFLPILAWLVIGFLSVLTNWFFSTLALDRGFFYFLKEIEFFFLYFYFFFYLKRIGDVKLLLNVWFILGVVNAGYVFYQIILKTGFGEYGARAINEWGAFPSGSFFVMLFLFFINIFAYYYASLKMSILKKIILGVLVLCFSAGAFSSASKTSFLALILSFALFAVLFFVKKRNIKLFLICILAAVLLVFLLDLVLSNISTTVRLEDAFSVKDVLYGYSRGRISVIKTFWNDVLNTPWYYYLIGRGGGFVHEAHNQFLRNLIEVGVIGSMIFLFLLFHIAALSLYSFFKSKDPLKIALSSGLLTITFAMFFFSFATEPFIVVKLSEAYWVFVAIAAAGLSL